MDYFSFSFCVFHSILFHFKHILRYYILYTLCIYNIISRTTIHISYNFSYDHTYIYIQFGIYNFSYNLQIITVGERCMENKKNSTHMQDLSMKMHSYERGSVSTYPRRP